MNENDEARAREEFRSRIQTWEAVYLADDANASRSNKLTDETHHWVDALGDDAKPVLLPLLDDVNAVIRGAAAAYLLSRGATDEARSTLEQIADDGNDLAASRADAVLLWWSRQV